MALLALVTGSILFATLLLANGLQILTLLIWPFSRHLFRRANRWIAHGWWGLTVFWAEKLHRIRLVTSGDALPQRENAIVFANHQSMPDILVLMMLAWPTKRLGDMKWFAKDIIKYFPGIGWGLQFLDCVFLKRDWDRDAGNIRRTFSTITDNKVPFWLMSFPEGTRLTPAKLDLAREHARKAGLPEPKHVLIPRVRGFTASVEGLRGHFDAVYDVTIGYPDRAPTMVEILGQVGGSLHVHVRRFAASELPLDDSQTLSRWLMERFRDKEALMEHFTRHGRFPA